MAVDNVISLFAREISRVDMIKHKLLQYQDCDLDQLLTVYTELIIHGNMNVATFFLPDWL